MQALDELGLRCGIEALLVGVLDAQNELPASLPGEQVVIQGCAGAANVESAGR
jgi:hypothetical protein